MPSAPAGALLVHPGASAQGARDWVMPLAGPATVVPDCTEEAQVGEALAKAPSGIAGLDELLMGGVPKGRPTLVCGGPGCGKTLLATSFLVHGAESEDESGVFISFDERTEGLAINSSSLGYDLDSLVERGRLALDYVHLDRNELEESGAFDLEGLFVRIDLAVRTVGARRVVLDTIDTLFAGLPNEAVVRSEPRRLSEGDRRHLGLPEPPVAGRAPGDRAGDLVDDGQLAVAADRGRTGAGPAPTSGREIPRHVPSSVAAADGDHCPRRPGDGAGPPGMSIEVAGGGAADTGSYDLRLYVAGHTDRSIRAIANLRRICGEHLAGRYTIEVIGLLEQPQLAAGDQILALPTLVRRLPPPLKKIIGDLSDEERVLVGLEIQPQRH